MPKISKKIAEHIKANNKSITQYLTTKNGNINEIQKNKDITNAANFFYKDCLESKINDCKAESHCHEVKEMLKNKLDLATEKLEKVKKANTICLEIIAKKDVIIEDLKKQIQPKPQNASTLPGIEASPPAMEASPPAMEAALPEKKVLFENCKRLRKHQLAKLR